MKTYVVSELHYPGIFVPVAIIMGAESTNDNIGRCAQDDAMQVCRARRQPGRKLLSASDTEWTEISIMGNPGTPQEYDILYSGSVLDIAASSGLPDGEYISCFNPRDLRDQQWQTWRIWTDADGVRRAGHRHI